MKKYSDNLKKKTPKQDFRKSDVACDESKCDGEMMILLPEIKHPELKLLRAKCGKCNWRGWV